MRWTTLLFACPAGGFSVIDSGLLARQRDVDDARCAEKPVAPIVAENCRQGSPPEEWDVNAAGEAAIQGFAVPFSVSPGTQVDFKVKAESRTFSVDVYRAGYYAGLGARKIVTLETRHGSQPPCQLYDDTLLVDCSNWEVSASWHIPPNAVSGVYFARLTLDDDLGNWRVDGSGTSSSPKFRNPDWNESLQPPCGSREECPAMAHAYGSLKLRGGADKLLHTSLQKPYASHAYFVVRAPAHEKHDVLFQTSDTTWQAYNTYIAPSTYGVQPLPRHNFSIPSWEGRRAYKKSYNTPIVTRDTRSVNMLFGPEISAIRFLEANGYNVSYWSGYDTHRFGAELADRAKVFLSVGHDEYWSAQQRHNVENARNQGVHLQFLSGNEVYWRIRWETGDGNPTLVVYKESQESRKIDPVLDDWTGTFRDARDINPVGAWPENSLTGTIWTANAWRNDPLLVPARFGNLRFWRNTGLDKLGENQTAVLMKGLLGHEFDEDLDNGYRPPGLMRLSETTVHNVQHIIDHGSTFDTGTCTHHLTLHRRGSSLVFGAGTVQWSWGLDSTHDASTGQPNWVENEYDTRVSEDPTGPDTVIQQAMVNLLADMGVQPASLRESLVAAEQTRDTLPPSSGVERAVSFRDGWEISGWAQDEGGLVGGVEVSVDGGRRWHPAEFRESVLPRFSWSCTSTLLKGMTVGESGELQGVLSRAVDDSGNLETWPAKNPVAFQHRTEL